jgi:hypothetical protein
MVIALQLAKAGWWGGDPGKVLKAPTEEVLAAIQYEQFLPDYERAIIEMNRENP